MPIKYEPIKQTTEDQSQDNIETVYQVSSITLPLSAIIHYWDAWPSTFSPRLASIDGAATNKVGRPMKGLEHATLSAQKPWQAMGMSRSTWYRRKKAGIV